MSTLTLQVTNALSVSVIPNSLHEFLMPTNDVATGYGVGDDTIRRHKKDHSDELIEGKHFISAVSIPHGKDDIKHNTTLWTKRGIVRLGFFIKSTQARLFRDWAEDLVIYATEKAPAQLEERIYQLEQSLAALTTNRQLIPTNPRPSATVLQQMVATDAIEVEMLRQCGLFTPSEISQIARAAGWFRMINNIDVKKARSMGYTSIENFRDQVFKCVLNEQNSTPDPLIRFRKGIITNERNLYVNAVQYRKQGIRALVHAGFGNTNSKRKPLINWTSNTTI